MLESWRWFGPKDTIPIEAVRETGTTGIVSALHQFAPGEVWPLADIRKRQEMIKTDAFGKDTGLHWAVVESLPVSEDIKRQSGPWKEHIASYNTSLKNLADAGLEIICYNFMPVLDWTRTDLAWATYRGPTCMRFEWNDFAAFDLFILKRARAEDDYDDAVREEAHRRFAAMDEHARKALAKNIVFGLPGAAANMSLDDVKQHIAAYDKISADRLRANLLDFLEEVAPVAQALGLRMCIHPDDPPFPLLGLPRVMSTESDYAALMKAVDIPANGITLCSGSLGSRADNDLPGMMQRLGDRVHFVHLRNVVRESPHWPGSFHESGHITGDVDMVALIKAILAEEAKRKKNGRADSNIPFRPDHGLDTVDDRKRTGQPGYPLVGRHVGLAELRGIIAGLSHA